MRSSKGSSIFVNIHELEEIAERWILDSEYSQHSGQTVASRKHITGKLLWWLRAEGLDCVGADEIKAFIVYVGAPPPPGGRWGNPQERQINRSGTVRTYWERLRTLFRYGVDEGLIPASPMEKMKPPTLRQDQVQTFTEQHIECLLRAASESRHPLRDTAIVYFLLDTGVRCSELCGLRVQDLDLENGRAYVVGKGNKRRPIFFEEATRDAVRRYLEVETRVASDAVFAGEHGAPLTRSGLLQLIERLGEKAGVTGVRCSPHTFRHTASIWAVRNGMNAFTLQAMLGHTNLKTTLRYVHIAQADLEAEHRRYSAVHRLGTYRAPRTT